MPHLSAVREGQRLVDFINTAYLPEGDDALADERATGWLADWLGIGTATAATRKSGDEAPLRRLRELREALRQFAAANNGAPPHEEAVDRAAAALGSIDLILDLGDHNRAPRMLTSATIPTVAERALAGVAECYLKSRLGEDWPRVKACASVDCRYAYLDTSRNRSRRWCEMSGCGNRAKNRAWRERQAAVQAVTTTRSDSVIGFVGGCETYRVVAQNRYNPPGARKLDAPNVLSTQIGAFAPNEVVAVDGWVHGPVAYPLNLPPFNSDIWFHLADDSGWVAFAAVRANPTVLDPTGLDPDGGTPAATPSECEGAIQ